MIGVTQLDIAAALPSPGRSTRQMGAPIFASLLSPTYLKFAS
jgi:hypothetical protein